MNRVNLTGAENRVYDLQKKIIARTTLTQSMDSILLVDDQVFHGVEPFKAQDENQLAHRDILILLYQPLSESPQTSSTISRLDPK